VTGPGREIEVLFGEDEIAARVEALAREIVAVAPGDLLVVGYGLDLAHRYRGLPVIGLLRRG